MAGTLSISVTFDADGGRLLAGKTEVPLEHRAARTLELLCRNRGRLVSRDTILAQVWEGRSVSANSVAVVIADLRRGLGDDAAAPRYIATVPKRGYRLSEEPPRAPVPASIDAARLRGPRRIAIALVAVALGGSAFFLVRPPRDTGRITVVVTQTANDTGQASYRPLATALQALVINRLAGMGVDVMTTETTPFPIGRPRMLWFRSRLILWNGISTLSMEAVDSAGQVTWTGMAVAPPNRLALATVAQMKTFEVKAGDR